MTVIKKIYTVYFWQTPYQLQIRSLKLSALYLDIGQPESWIIFIAISVSYTHLMSETPNAGLKGHRQEINLKGDKRKNQWSVQIKESEAAAGFLLGIKPNMQRRFNP